MRLGCALWLALIVTASVSDQTLAGQQRLIYAAQNDGTIHVYNIDDQHAEVKVIGVFSCCADVRGISAAVPTHRLYAMYNRNSEGHVAAIDLVSDQVIWDRVLHTPGVDRGNLTPDGTTLYLPTWEEDPRSAYELVIDPESGAEKGRITLPPRSHDTLVSLDGQRVFMETKSPTASLSVADTASNQVMQEIGGYCCGGVLGPFSVNGTGTRIVNDVNGYDGFQVADVVSGRVTDSVLFASGQGGHGIAWTPDERQVWVNDGTAPVVHVFDMTVRPPKEMQPVTVSNVPHWITFGLDGRYAYVAGRKGSEDVTDVIDTTTYQRVSSLGPSEDLLEVDFASGSVLAVGNQFGIGRVTSPAP